MMRNEITRRNVLLAPLWALAPGVAAPGDPAKSIVAVVRSSHRKLRQPVSSEHPLDYPLVRDMVWKAIEYGRTRAGSLADKVRPGSWVVVKPNIVFLRPQPGYRPGDITDMRVTKAVVEYLAKFTRARRITVAEGGSYRRPADPKSQDHVLQAGAPVTAATFDWGAKDFPGFGLTIDSMFQGFAREFPEKTFDFVDLSYDAVRDASGSFRRIEVPRTPRGVGALSSRSDYFVTNTIVNCDFLISVPVAKVHELIGMTSVFKNYVGTAPREANQGGVFANGLLHSQHEVEGRVDPFVVDLAAFHPPDYCVVDGIRGLQYTEHNNCLADQEIRNNLVLAGEDPVATDAVVAKLLGFNPWDLEFLHMAAQRDMGTMNFGMIDVVGDDFAPLCRRWVKPRTWHGRGNREWLITLSPAAPIGTWRHVTAPTDTLKPAQWGSPAASGSPYSIATRVHAPGHRKGLLSIGVQGQVTAVLNGEKVFEVQHRTQYRVAQYQQAVELRSGENLLVFNLRGFSEQPLLSAIMMDPRNDGDTVEDIRWSA